MFCERCAVLGGELEKAFLEVASAILILFKKAPREIKFRIVCPFKSYLNFLKKDLLSYYSFEGCCWGKTITLGIYSVNVCCL